jgi:hypothetical protein
MGEWSYSSTHSLTSAVDGGELSASRTGRYFPRERTPGTHWMGGWEGPRAVLDTVVTRYVWQDVTHKSFPNYVQRNLHVVHSVFINKALATDSRLHKL